MSSLRLLSNSARSLLFWDHPALPLDVDADESDTISVSLPGEETILEDRL